MTRTRRTLGDVGEEIATRHLKRLGYTIVERNVRFRIGEIDIVARDGEFLVFVEVRARRSERWGSALESVGPQKKRKLIQLAHYYLANRRLGDVTCRFDVVGVTWDSSPEAPKIELVRNAIELS